MKNFIVSAGVFFGICLIYFLIMMSKTDWTFTYLLDDAYIHLALAKNFALYDVWGVTRHAFSSSSSSPIFTGLVALFIKIFGNIPSIPLVFNFLLTVGIIFFLTKYYVRFYDNTAMVVGSVLVTTFSAALYLQIFSGMEHILQVFLVILNIYFLTDWVSNNFKKYYSLIFFYGTLLLLGLVRFEMMFYFVSLAFFLAFMRKFWVAALVLFLGFAPIFIFSYFNYQQTGFLFPNSVIVKGANISFRGNILEQIRDVVVTAFLNRSFYKRCLLPLSLLLMVIVIDYKNRKSRKEFYSDNFLLFTWAATMLLHSVFADLKSILRYEAYIIVAFAMLIIPKLKGYITNFRTVYRKNILLTLLIAGNLVLMISKMVFSHKILMFGSKNIYEQQVQSAKFLQTYYNTAKVAANDIGAISYFTDIHLFDIVGLGSPEIMEFNKRSDDSDRAFGKYVGDRTKKQHYQIAIVYKEWLRGHVPNGWEEIAVLTIEKNAVVSQPEVTIYCMDPKISESLKYNIKRFEWNKNVKVRINE